MGKLYGSTPPTAANRYALRESIADHEKAAHPEFPAKLLRHWPENQ
jgi:hypothetical protein